MSKRDINRTPRSVGYTPGPWETGFEPVFTKVRAVSSQRLICDCMTPGNTWPQDRKNAALVAAAPELLSALKMLMKAYESVLPGLAKIAVQDYALINDAPVAATRAIMKAEGEGVKVERCNFEETRFPDGAIRRCCRPKGHNALANEADTRPHAFDNWKEVS